MRVIMENYECHKQVPFEARCKQVGNPEVDEDAAEDTAVDPVWNEEKGSGDEMKIGFDIDDWSPADREDELGIVGGEGEEEELEDNQ